MEWISLIKKALNFMETELLTIKSPEEVAQHVHISTMYLQKGFQILTGYSIGEYLKNRKLYLAAMDMINTNEKIIDIAYKYGYETPESFTKAFTRFHKATPTEIRKRKTNIRTFLPLRVTMVIQGGYNMDYTIEKMPSFKLIGFSKEFSFDTSYNEIPKFWDLFFSKYHTYTEEIKQVILQNRIGEFGLCIDDIGKENKFRYMIAGKYLGGNIPQEMEVYELKEGDWAIFKCFGPMPEALQTVNTQIFKEWLPGNTEYDLAGNYNIEWYSSQGKTTDEDYQSAIWIPVRRK